MSAIWSFRFDKFHGDACELHWRAFGIAAYRQLVTVPAWLLFAHLPLLRIDDHAGGLGLDVAG